MHFYQLYFFKVHFPKMFFLIVFLESIFSQTVFLQTAFFHIVFLQTKLFQTVGQHIQYILKQCFRRAHFPKKYFQNSTSSRTLTFLLAGQPHLQSLFRFALNNLKNALKIYLHIVTKGGRAITVSSAFSAANSRWIMVAAYTNRCMIICMINRPSSVLNHFIDFYLISPIFIHVHPRTLYFYLFSSTVIDFHGYLGHHVH